MGLSPLPIAVQSCLTIGIERELPESSRGLFRVLFGKLALINVIAFQNDTEKYATFTIRHLA